MPTERERMLAGELYDSLDPELVAARERARNLCQDLNATREAEQQVRRRLLTQLFGTGGEDVSIQPPFFCDYGQNIYLGRKCYFNFNCSLLDVCEIRIGDYCLFGPNVQIYTPLHPMEFERRRPPANDDAKAALEYGSAVTIGSDVWVGGGAIICPGVTIGSRTIIGAGSVVTREIPDAVFAAGNPCRVIRAISG